MSSLSLHITYVHINASCLLDSSWDHPYGGLFLARIKRQHNSLTQKTVVTTTVETLALHFYTQQASRQNKHRKSAQFSKKRKTARSITRPSSKTS